MLHTRRILSRDVIARYRAYRSESIPVVGCGQDPDDDHGVSHYARAPVHGLEFQARITDVTALAVLSDETSAATKWAGSRHHKGLHHDIPGAAAGVPEIVGHLHPQPGLGRRAEGL